MWTALFLPQWHWALQKRDPGAPSDQPLRAAKMSKVHLEMMLADSRDPCAAGQAGSGPWQQLYLGPNQSSSSKTSVWIRGEEALDLERHVVSQGKQGQWMEAVNKWKISRKEFWRLTKSPECEPMVWRRPTYLLYPSPANLGMDSVQTSWITAILAWYKVDIHGDIIRCWNGQ